MMNKLIVTTLIGISIATGLFAAENEIKYPLTGYPKGYELKNGAGAKLSIAQDAGIKVLKFTSGNIEKYLRIRTNVLSFKPNTKYMLTIKVKTDADFKTKKGKAPDGVLIMLRGEAKPFLRVSGNGASDGWITCFLPFDSTNLPSARFTLRFNNTGGTVLLKELKIMPIDEASFAKGSRFKIGDNTVKENTLTL